MISEFFVQLLFHASAPEQRPQPKRDRVPPRREAHFSCLLELHDARDGARKPAPVSGFLRKLPAAEPRQRIELGAAIILASFPFGGDPARLLELVQCGIKRSVADLQYFTRHLLQSLADCPAIQRLQRQDLQDQEIQSALDEITRSAHSCPLGYR